MSVKVESVVCPFTVSKSVYVKVGNQTVTTAIHTLPRDVIEQLCDLFKRQTLELYDQACEAKSTNVDNYAARAAACRF